MLEELGWRSLRPPPAAPAGCTAHPAAQRSQTGSQTTCTSGGLRKVTAWIHLNCVSPQRGVAPLGKDTTKFEVKRFLFQNEASFPQRLIPGAWRLQWVMVQRTTLCLHGTWGEVSVSLSESHHPEVSESFDKRGTRLLRAQIHANRYPSVCFPLRVPWEGLSDSFSPTPHFNQSLAPLGALAQYDKKPSIPEHVPQIFH